MKGLKNYSLFLMLAAAVSCTGNKAPLSVTWADEKGDNVFILKNVSRKPLKDNWTLYLTQLPKTIKETGTDALKIESVNGNYYRIYPGESYESLAPGDSIVFRCSITSPLRGISYVPDGFYMVMTDRDGKELAPVSVPATIVLPDDERLMQCSNPRNVFKKNSDILYHAEDSEVSPVLPTVKSYTEHGSTVTFPKQIRLECGTEGLDGEAAILKERLHTLYGVECSDDAPFRVSLSLSGEGEAGSERYTLSIAEDSVGICGDDADGVFNGAQTLLSLLKNGNSLKCGEINDYPDLHYRGVMMDVARNFLPADDLKKLLDVFSSYKINKLHLHFIDDEGWRIEIPGLEELTEVGAYRRHTLDESKSLFPGYGSSYSETVSPTAGGYFTRAEFIDLLQYAAARHISVIPELESPGHSRAAIVAMKARYAKYISTDPQKAEEYLLSEAEDESEYVSAQSYSDNVMNMALPSTYRFVDKVVSEIAKMYEEAGVKLEMMHLGGDEVPRGAWMNSPACKKLMEQEGLSKTSELSAYYFLKVNEILQAHGLRLAGWQETGIHDSTGGLTANTGAIYVWNTIPEWRDDEVPYRLANKGYPVVLCNVNNFYMDLSYTDNYMEPGLDWGGHVDESASFSMLPFRIYRSSRTTKAGKPVNLDSLETGKEKLQPEAVANIKGVQVQLFSETIRSLGQAERYLFPKMLGMVERGWNARPMWEGEPEEAYWSALSGFYRQLSQTELPYLNRCGYDFHIPAPGICVEEDGSLLVNSPLYGSEIRYTVDGSEPTEQSSLWEGPVSIDGSKVVKACLFYLGKKSETSTLVL